MRHFNYPKLHTGELLLFYLFHTMLENSAIGKVKALRIRPLFQAVRQELIETLSEDDLYRHTLCSLEHLLSDEDEMMFRNNGCRIPTVSLEADLELTGKASRFLICPECGIPLRDHQLPGVEYCAIHGIPLSEYRLPDEYIEPDISTANSISPIIFKTPRQGIAYSAFLTDLIQGLPLDVGYHIIHAALRKQIFILKDRYNINSIDDRYHLAEGMEADALYGPGLMNHITANALYRIYHCMTHAGNTALPDLKPSMVLPTLYVAFQDAGVALRMIQSVSEIAENTIVQN